jgi:hypothetical protein
VASYVVSAGNVGVHAKTLAASTVDTVTFTGKDLPSVEVLSDGSADIYVCFGTGTPTVGGGNCQRIPAGSGGAILPVHTTGDTVVKLISAGTPVYSVSNPT